MDKLQRNEKTELNIYAPVDIMGLDFLPSLWERPCSMSAFPNTLATSNFLVPF